MPPQSDPVGDDLWIVPANLPLPYHCLDSDGRILFVNAEWLEFLGFTNDQAVGLPFVNFLAPSSAREFAGHLEACKVRGHIRHVKLAFLNHQGETLPVWVGAKAERDRAGRITCSHWLILDRHEELPKIEGVQKTEAKYRRLVELAKEGIWEIGADAKTIYVNPAMAAMLGYSEDEMIGRHLFDFMDEESIRVARNNLNKREKGLSEQHDFTFIHQQGHKVLTTLETSPLFDEEGRYSGSLAGVINVTERRRLEGEMFHRQKLESLGVLAGGIAHDFNNLLQAVVGHVELAREILPGDSEVQYNLAEISKASQRATDLCRQMLAYAGKGSFTVDLLDLSTLIKDMSQILKISISKNTQLEIDVGEDLPSLRADRAQIAQVVMNLITNASEALQGETGLVRVVANPESLDRADLEARFPKSDLRPGQFIVLKVDDTGCGMNEEVHGRLFDPFFSTKFTGRGLGMASVLGIIKAHNGAIRVESSPGQGTSVTIALPALGSAMQTLNVSGGAVVAPRSTSGTVLLAEDEESVRHLVERMLFKLDQKVILARNGREAVEQFGKNKAEISLVLLDMTMPVLDGVSAWKEIMVLDPEAVVYIYSGFPEENTSALSKDDRPTGFLQKPFSLEQLRALVSPSV